MIIYRPLTEINDEELVEKRIERNIHTITEEQKKMIKGPKTGPCGTDRHQLVIEVPWSIREILLKQPRIYIGFELTNIKEYFVVSTCLQRQELGTLSDSARMKSGAAIVEKRDIKRTNAQTKTRRKLASLSISGTKNTKLRTSKNVPNIDVNYKEK